MTVPGSFTLTDVTYRNAPELALRLAQTAGFAALTYGPNFSDGLLTPTGLDPLTTYTADVTVDGVVVPVSVLGSAALTFGTLIAQINTDLGVAAVASLVGNVLVITSATTGILSTVVVVDTLPNKLFAAVQQSGSAGFGLQTNVSTVGNDLYLRWGKLNVTEQQYVADVMEFADVGDTPWTYATDSVRTTGAGLTVNSVMGIAAGTYNLRVTVDGVGPTVVASTVAAGATFQEFLDDAFLPALKAAFPAASASFVQVNATTLDLLVESGTPGVAGAVVVIDGASAGWIAAVEATVAWSCAIGAAVAGVSGVAGTGLPTGLLAARPVQPQARGSLYYATDTALLYLSDGANWVSVVSSLTLPSLNVVLNNVQSPTGFGPLFTSSTVSVVEVQAKPASLGQAVLTNVYYDGVAAAWKYFANDALVGSAPPVINAL